MARNRPKLYLIAGPNGAGKSTLYDEVIKPKVAAEFVNADVIERQQNEQGNTIDSYEAARMAAQRRNELIGQRKSFVTETVFSHESKNELVEQARDAGYGVFLYHVNVRSDNISVSRVAARVDSGGHDVPEDKIRARYDRNQPLIRQAAREADRSFIYDNSAYGRKPRLAIELRKGEAVKVDRVPAWARDLYKDELASFSQTKINAAAQSFADARKITQQKLSPDAQTRIPEKGTTYQGKIIGQTSQHLVQQIDKNTAIAHFTQGKKDLAKPGDVVSIRYGRSRSGSTITRHSGKASDLDR